MLEMIMDKQILVILMGVTVAVGIFSKGVVSISLKRLVKASGDMGKSSHALVRLVRAKYEHACMVSERVQNADVFVEKYIHEYQVLGIHLFRWRRWEKISAWVCIGLGLAEAFGEYSLYGMSDMVIRHAALGGVLGIFLYLLRAMSGEDYSMSVVHNYMVDYLDNVCARKYEKTREREKPELPNPQEKTPGIEVPERRGPVQVPISEPMETPVTTQEPVQEPEPTRLFTKKEEELTKKEKRKLKETAKDASKETEKELRIREILEEFLA